jgi:hypothetical protein
MIETSPTIAAISAALTKAQAAMGGAVKDSENPFFDSKYADLESVTEAIRKPATANDLSWVQGAGTDENGVVSLTTLVMHSSGEWIKTTVQSRPKDITPQSVGSAITYNRRYGLAAAFGVYQTDDDGNAAQGNRASVIPLDQKIKEELEAAAKQGVGAFRDYWKTLEGGTRKKAQADKAWFGALRATAEGNGAA